VILQKEATHNFDQCTRYVRCVAYGDVSVFVNTLLIPESPTMTADGGKSERGWL